MSNASPINIKSIEQRILDHATRLASDEFGALIKPVTDRFHACSGVAGHHRQDRDGLDRLHGRIAALSEEFINHVARYLADQHAERFTQGALLFGNEELSARLIEVGKLAIRQGTLDVVVNDLISSDRKAQGRLSSQATTISKVIQHANEQNAAIKTTLSALDAAKDHAFIQIERVDRLLKEQTPQLATKRQVDALVTAHDKLAVKLTDTRAELSDTRLRLTELEPKSKRKTAPAKKG